ncbi:adenylate/guanylate cyclase domain-containing protein [Actinomycetospora chiangmaiensis]|uniref:adenylate/guanylate cyclase domain-containing protein n=1 Tax=Actinomycetospora chiangmaiensis TaxID=402650 RepID=UPI000362D498|nr:adenylate/guanylate cyclase domain-containing protein [Actinomycetospora chiangmaiensis]
MPDETSETPHQVALSTKVLVGALIVVSNVVGAAILVGLGAWVLPFRALVSDETAALRTNLLLLGGYAPLAGLAAFAFGWAWLRVPEPPGPAPTAAELACHRQRARRVVLRAPVRLAVVQAVPWTIGVALFAVVDASWSRTLAGAVACMIALGGIATVTVAYRFSELVMRREVARVFVQEPPTEKGLPGVAVRSLGAWVMGTGVPLLGVVLTAGTSLIYADYFTVQRLGLVVLVLALVSLSVGFLVTVLSSTSIVASVTAVRRALRRVEQGDLATRVRVSDTTELGLLQSGFNTMVAGLRERDRVRELFGRQVGEAVAEAALAGDVELGGEVREVAVLFVDLVGSTALAATRPPTEVVARLNVFFTEVVDAVERHGGWVNKFEGDAALAVFGAPQHVDGPATRALATARELADRLERRGAHAGIGVSAGEAVAGHVGDARRYEYTVIGDPVNEAARLCDLAKRSRRWGESGDAAWRGVAASGAALERADRDEARRWLVIGAERLRGRTADTRVAVPRDRHVTTSLDVTAAATLDEATNGVTRR